MTIRYNINLNLLFKVTKGVLAQMSGFLRSFRTHIALRGMMPSPYQIKHYFSRCTISVNAYSENASVSHGASAIMKTDFLEE